MEVLIMGIAMFFNFAIIYVKLNKGKGTHAALDGAIFMAIMYITAGSQGGMYAGTVASALFSVFLLFSPPTFIDDFFGDSQEKEPKC